MTEQFVLSELLADLYRNSETAGTSEFLNQFFPLLRNMVGFERGYMDIGDRKIDSHPDRLSHASLLGTSPLHLFNNVAATGCNLPRDRLYVCDHAATSKSCLAACQANKNFLIALFGESALRYTQSLVYIYHPLPQNRPCWIVLARHGRPFSSMESESLLAIWPHLLNAYRQKLARRLDSVDADFLYRATALVHSTGTILASDPCFDKYLKAEWPDTASPARLPTTVITSLQSHGLYRGKSVALSILDRKNNTYFVCRIEPTCLFP